MVTKDAVNTGLFQDWEANQGSPKGRFVTLFFRLCQRVRRLPGGSWILGSPLLGLYVLVIHWIMGIEIDYRSDIGPGLSLQHGTGLVIHPEARIGAECLLRQGVTIGDRLPRQGLPVLGNNVNVGANALILGPVRVGDGAVIGAGSVVIHDVAPGCVVAGNPARILRSQD
ncbi:MAG: serine O-acetyltransferase [Chthoniobacterales bacterium]|jgi:serine acetyltransferase